MKTAQIEALLLEEIVAACPELEPEVLAVAVCDDAAYFEAICAGIGVELAERFGLPVPAPGDGWRVVEGFKGRGYGLATPDELRIQRRLALEEGVFVDLYQVRLVVGHLQGSK